MLVLGILPVPGVATAGDTSADIVVWGILPERIDTASGSVRLIDTEELARMQPLTIKDVLRRAPGLQVVDEDALGLKLNVSVRGLNPQRSGRTLLLEDGAPIQPAPYADPSAHHHTPLERIERIELRKGSGQILYGPQSIGGMINFVTRPVPNATELMATLSGGERGYFGLHLNAGTGNATSGIRIDLLSKRADGTRDFHRTQVNEIAVKGRVELGSAHALTLKTAYYTEDSSVTEG